MSRTYQLLDSLNPLVFDGNVAVCFIVTMHNNVTTARVKNIAPGAMYTFVFYQDAQGGHVFLWPASCINASPVALEPGSSTVQSFIGTAEGNLQANLPATWSA